ncbi:MAG: hypothetical protein R2729_00270 [Bryobacteraceae bacterium]
MAPDSDDLLRAIGSAFGVSALDRRLEDGATFRDVQEVLVANLSPGTGEQRVTALASTRLKLAVTDVIGLATIEDDAPLRSIFPLRDRLWRWKRIADRSELILPQLSLPLSLSICGGIGAGTALASIVLWLDAGTGAAAGAAIAGVLAGVFIAGAIGPLRISFGDLATFEELVRVTTAANFGRLVAAGGAWDETEVWASLQRFVAERQGWPLHNVTPDARLDEDLGNE